MANDLTVLVQVTRLAVTLEALEANELRLINTAETDEVWGRIGVVWRLEDPGFIPVDGRVRSTALLRLVDHARDSGDRPSQTAQRLRHRLAERAAGSLAGFNRRDTRSWQRQLRNYLLAAWVSLTHSEASATSRHRAYEPELSVLAGSLTRTAPPNLAVA
jgi:hypothetical protein